MPYTKTDWKQRLREHPNRVRLIDPDTGQEVIRDMQRIEGEIIEEGTALSPANLNKIEEGIKSAHQEIARIDAKSTWGDLKGGVDE